MSRRSAEPRSKRQYVEGHNIPALRLARIAPGAKQAIFPEFIPPSLAILEPKPPGGKDWVHEVKYDGYRFQCHIHRGIRFYTRRGYDWSDRMQHLATALEPLSQHAAILDGEVIVQTADGRSDFHELEKELRAKGGSRRLVYYVFDLLYLDAFDLRAVALLDRKRILAELLSGVHGPVKFSEHIQGDGPAVWKRACELNLEGVVSKRVDGRYLCNRNPSWIKATCRHRDTFAVAGWAFKNGKFDGLYLAEDEDGELVYVGKLARGFSDADKKQMLERLKPLRIRRPPMSASRKTFPKAKWAKPHVLVDAEFRGRTAGNLLRHPSFKGVREDLMDDFRK